MGPADHTEFLGPQIYTLTTGYNNITASIDRSRLFNVNFVNVYMIAYRVHV